MINQEIFNVAGENLKVIDIARKVQQKINKSIEIKIRCNTFKRCGTSVNNENRVAAFVSNNINGRII